MQHVTDNPRGPFRATESVGVELGVFTTRSDNKHSFEKRFSQLPPEERRAVADDLLVRAREVLENEGMVLPIEQRDVALDLSKPAPFTMANLLNLTHATLLAEHRPSPARRAENFPRSGLVAFAGGCK